jgi:extradiol dioxygenase family protein
MTALGALELFANDCSLAHQSLQPVYRRLSWSANRCFKGESGEEATLLFMEPSGNAIELNAFTNITRLFAK